MIVNMNQLRSFYTAAKLNSIAKAAQALMVTPPAITQHIKRFEESIGIRLLVREAHSIRLTSTGEGVMQRAEKIFQEIHEMEGYLEDISAGKSGDLRVGCPEAPLQHLAPLIEAFRKSHPGVKIILDQGTNAEMVKSIVDHRNELAGIVGMGEPRILKDRLVEDRLRRNGPRRDRLEPRSWRRGAAAGEG